ncbi:hypothetical protein BZA77DRAFT_294980 [Pyronema omphalodes]|nr:hypothetical protein BZA77DRAFT_294980 [Pyronema omphalodes]
MPVPVPLRRLLALLFPLSSGTRMQPQTKPQDFYAAATADPIVNRLEQMNDQDHQAARNVGLPLAATDVGAIHPFAISTAIVAAPDAGVDARDQQRGLGDVREADTF